MESFCIYVTPAGNGYLAENLVLEISAGGESPMEAAEKVRTMACEVLRQTGSSMPQTIVACLEDDGAVAFVMRPFRQSLVEYGVI